MNILENYNLLKPKFKSLKEAHQYGKVMRGNSKIHGSTFSTDPFQCKVGETLATIENSTCKSCYARKLAKVYPSARKSWEDNLKLFRQVQNDGYNRVLWCESIAFQILHISLHKQKTKKLGAGLHRWFSSGDLDSETMLRAIIYVCKLTPTINHWLPTREKGILKAYLAKLGTIPENLCIRVSDAMIDESNGKDIFKGHKITFSSVHTGKVKQGKECYAPANSGECGSCRACWDTSVNRISYKKH